MLPRFVFLLSLAISLAPVAVAEHVHDIHTSTPHGPVQSCGGRFQRQSSMPTAGMAEPVVVVDADEWITIYDETFENTTCDDIQAKDTFRKTYTDSVKVVVGVEVCSF